MKSNLPIPKRLFEKQRRYLASAEGRAKHNAYCRNYAKKRYRDDPEWRKKKADESREWRGSNPDYDTLRKLCREWFLSKEQRDKKNAKYREWIKNLSPDRRESYKAHKMESAKAWAYKQRRDALTGWAYRAMYDKRNATAQEREAAREYYREMKSFFKALKRVQIISERMNRCKTGQREKIVEMLAKSNGDAL